MKNLSPEIEKKYYSMSRENCFTFPDNPGLDNEFIKMCESGKLKEALYLLVSPNLKTHASIHAKKDEAFITACKKGHLDIIEALLISPELSEHIDIHTNNKEGLITACEYGHLNIVQYLLTSPKLKDHADIHAKNDEVFVKACWHGHVDIAQYLIEQGVNYQIKMNTAFQFAYWNTKIEVMKFLIFDLNIELTDKIKEIIKANDETVKGFFEKRELNKKLTQNMNVKETIETKRNKI